MVPQVQTPVGGWPIGSIGDYFGLPTVGQVSAGKSVSHSELKEQLTPEMEDILWRITGNDIGKA